MLEVSEAEDFIDLMEKLNQNNSRSLMLSRLGSVNWSDLRNELLSDEPRSNKIEYFFFTYTVYTNFLNM